jgi:hypothetical protein
MTLPSYTHSKVDATPMRSWWRLTSPTLGYFARSAPNFRRRLAFHPLEESASGG